MQNKTTVFRIINMVLLTGLFMFFMYCTFNFQLINQPSNALPNSTINVDMQVTYSGSSGEVVTPYFSLLLPMGWTIPGDTLVYTDQSGNGINGVISWDSQLTDSIKVISPPPAGYFWWSGKGDNHVAAAAGYVSSTLTILNDSQIGTFGLTYVLGDSYSGGLIETVSENFIAIGPAGSPGLVSNASPANNSIGIFPNGSISWDFGNLTDTYDLFFGEAGSMVQVVTGATAGASDSYDFSNLLENTTYEWQVISHNASGLTTNGPVWKFSTSAVIVNTFPYFQDFENGGLIPDGWTNDITDSGEDWKFNLSATYGPDNDHTTGTGYFAWVDDSSPNFSPTNLITPPINLTGMNSASLSFWYWSFNEGVPITDTAWLHVDVLVNDVWYYDITDSIGHELQAWQEKTVDLTPYISTQTAVRFRFVESDSYYQDIAIDDITIDAVVPVELTSFAANVGNGNVTLNWTTATETNNSGFDVERSSDNINFNQIAFVNGHGSTTEPQSYAFIDNSITGGNYYYRLKQVDFDGSFEYTEVLEVNIRPETYSLSQNYPNPFNPSTVIQFAVPTDAKVSIKLYNTLGQEVMQLVNQNYEAGSYRYQLNASSLSSGVYFYTIEANGIDGNNFIATKKLMLLK